MPISPNRAIAALALLINLSLLACNRGDRPVALPPPPDLPSQVEPGVDSGVDLDGAIEPPPAEPASPSPIEQQANVQATLSEPLFSEALRSQYNGIDLESRSEAQRSGSDPEAMAQAMLGAQESVEGSYRESSEAEIGNERAVVVFLRENLADDSVQAIRTRLEFFRIDGPWQLEWAGEQYRCQEGRGQQDWSKDLCA
jgi:hypothetical protein